MATGCDGRIRVPLRHAPGRTARVERHALHGFAAQRDGPRVAQERAARNQKRLARLDQQIAAVEDAVQRTAAELHGLSESEQQLQFDLDVGEHSASALRAALSDKELDLERLIRQQADSQADLDVAAAE